MSALAAEVAGLTLRVPTRARGERAWVHAAERVDLRLPAGRVHALVGESGCGKSMLGSALIGLLPPGTRREGALYIAGTDMLHAPERTWRRVRGRQVGLVGQSAATGLTPTRTLGSQLTETLRVVAPERRDRSGLRRAAEEAVCRVGLAPDDLARYPHELSGGMAQRAMLAFALAGRPRVLVADEPSAGLDPDLTDHVLRLLRAIADDQVSVLLITHDLGALLRTPVADDLSVMYAGSILESGAAAEVLSRPSSPYTRALLAALPQNGLHPIPGAPPDLTEPWSHRRFEDRLEAVR